MGKLAEIKTKQTSLSVTDFVDSIAVEQKHKDSQSILNMMKKVTREERKWRQLNDRFWERKI